jgi:copper chaperone
LSTTTYQVAGLSCSHCVSAVTEELRALPEVTDVHIDLVADGVSAVTVTSTEPLADDKVAEALDEAGDYRLAGR